MSLLDRPSRRMHEESKRRAELRGRAGDVLSHDGQHPARLRVLESIYLRAHPSYARLRRDDCMPAQSPNPLKGL